MLDVKDLWVPLAGFSLMTESYGQRYHKTLQNEGSTIIDFLQIFKLLDKNVEVQQSLRDQKWDKCYISFNFENVFYLKWKKKALNKCRLTNSDFLFKGKRRYFLPTTKVKPLAILSRPFSHIHPPCTYSNIVTLCAPASLLLKAIYISVSSSWERKRSSTESFWQPPKTILFGMYCHFLLW